MNLTVLFISRFASIKHNHIHNDFATKAISLIISTSKEIESKRNGIEAQLHHSPTTGRIKPEKTVKRNTRKRAHKILLPSAFGPMRLNQREREKFLR